MRFEKTYNGFEVQCNVCGHKIEQVWHQASSGKVLDQEVTYECLNPACIQKEAVSSERYWEYHKYVRDRLEMEQVEEAVKIISDFVNRGGDKKKFAERMGREHRTLQQLFTGVCMEWFTSLSKLEEYQYDGRNEASVALAKKIVAIDERYLPLV